MKPGLLSYTPPIHQIHIAASGFVDAKSTFGALVVRSALKMSQEILEEALLPSQETLEEALRCRKCMSVAFLIEWWGSILIYRDRALALSVRLTYSP